MIAEELQAAWAAEAANHDRNPYVGLRLQNSRKVEAYAGVDRDGRRRFLGLRVTPAERKNFAEYYPRSSSGILVEGVPGADGVVSIFLREQAGTPEPVFRTVITDVLQIADRADPLRLRMAFERFASWQRALQRRIGPLAGPEVRGIWGELMVLRDILVPTLGVARALDTWRSPEDDHPHDFVGSGWEIEVKTGLAPATSFFVGTQGQLEAASEVKLSLFTVELERADDGLRVADIADELIKATGGEAGLMDRVKNGLVQRGASNASLDAELDVRYRCVSVVGHQVADGFPRILSSRLPLGIEDVSYKVSIDTCVPFRTSTQEIIASVKQQENQS